jgi:hypothetical protein
MWCFNIRGSQPRCHADGNSLSWACPCALKAWKHDPGGQGPGIDPSAAINRYVPVIRRLKDVFEYIQRGIDGICG